MKQKERQGFLLADLIIPVLGAILAIYYLYTVRGIARMAQMYGGFLSITVILLALWVVAVAIRDGAFSGLSQVIKLTSDSKQARTYRRATLLMLQVAVYIWLVPYIGYPLASLLFMCGVMYYLGAREPLPIIGVSLLVTGLGFALFVLFLNVPLPMDPVSEMIRSIFR